VLTSFGLSCTLLLLLGVLTLLGTLEQVDHGLYAVQKKYFESYVLVHHLGPLPIPLPGANLVLCVLFVNLVLGGMVRMRRTWSRAGILVTHVGIALLLVSGFVKLHFSEEGHVTLFEGQRASEFSSYYRWELAIARDLGDGKREEFLVPHEDLFAGATLRADALPFDLELGRFLANAQPAGGPRGVTLRELPRDPTAERNLAGADVALVEKRSGRRVETVLWGAEGLRPWTVDVDGTRRGIALRHERYPMPVTLALDEFTKVDHPRSSMPRSFSSEVTVIEGAAERSVEISMNQPLREGGLVVYQASWGPSNAGPNDPLFSTLAVARNPSDRYPLVACIVIAAGLVLHFSRKLVRYIRNA
jgi:hypothetical protein